MKKTLYKNELKNKAFEFQKSLEKRNIHATFGSDSFKDYVVKLNVGKYGSLLIYYKPTKNIFSLKKQLNNTNISTVIDSVWDQTNGFFTYPAESGIYEVFVDGSYISGTVGYGVIIYLGDEIKAELSGVVSDVQFRQFSGELKSVIEAIKWCQKNAIKKIRINYDYYGVEKFITAEWKAKNNTSKEYVEFILKTHIIIEWRYVKSHTGNTKNEKVDFLAKKAIEIRQN
ncbi:MAG: reverse transcriptase-like protein [Endomicrobium sp.]|jgi:ribonuclease HI|nr:reverse transcriptase-like protein [Endomicrobium sp.]